MFLTLLVELLSFRILNGIALATDHDNSTIKVPVTLKEEEQSQFASVCVTETCILQADTMVRMMDDTVDPCQDFYSFACGGFEKESIIPEYKDIQGMDMDLRNSLRMKFKEIFESKGKKGDPPIFKGFFSFISMKLSTNAFRPENSLQFLYGQRDNQEVKCE